MCCHEATGLYEVEILECRLWELRATTMKRVEKEREGETHVRMVIIIKENGQRVIQKRDWSFTRRKWLIYGSWCAQVTPPSQQGTKGSMAPINVTASHK